MVLFNKCHRTICKKTTLCLVLIWIIILGLNITILLPSILDGPTTISNLKRTTCKITDIIYLQNYCNINTNNYNQLFALLYKTDWNICYIGSFHMFYQLNEIDTTTTTTTYNCSYLYPNSFQDIQQATRDLHSYFNETIDCVINTINNECYPDKNELEWLIATVSTNTLILIILISIIIYLSVCKNKNIFMRNRIKQSPSKSKITNKNI